MLIEKARRLAEQGRRVVFIVAFNDWSEAKKARIEVGESDHFLFQDLRSRFAKLKTVTLEFVHLMKVGDRVRELASEKEEVNIFVDEFGGFESTEDGQNVWKDLTLPIPEVSTF